MNKILFYILLFVTFLFINQTDALPLDPLHLGKTVKKLLSKVGIATYYDVEAGVGSCGLQSKHTQRVVAVNYAQMDNGANPNENPKCGQQVRIVGPDGDTYMADIVDTCPGCDTGCLDMSSSCKSQSLNTYK